jgi:hypothetical protein
MPSCLAQLRPYGCLYFRPERPSSDKLAITFTDFEALLREEAGEATPSRLEAQNDETSLTLAQTDFRAGRDGPGDMPTTPGRPRGAKICPVARGRTDPSIGREIPGGGKG